MKKTLVIISLALLLVFLALLSEEFNNKEKFTSAPLNSENTRHPPLGELHIDKILYEQKVVSLHKGWA